ERNPPMRDLCAPRSTTRKQRGAKPLRRQFRSEWARPIIARIGRSQRHVEAAPLVCRVEDRRLGADFEERGSSRDVPTPSEQKNATPRGSAHRRDDAPHLLCDGIHSQRANLVAGLPTIKPGWFGVAAVLTLQKGFRESDGDSAAPSSKSAPRERQRRASE